MASNPIDQIRSQIDAAATIPSAEPFFPSDHPLERLLRTIDDARNGRDVPSANENQIPAAAAAAAEAAPAVVPSGGLDSVVGQQVLALLEGRALSGEARAEAVRRLALAMQNPTTQNLQAVLDVLLTGEPGVGQSR